MLRTLYADKQNVIVPWALLSRMRTLIGSGLWGNAVGVRLQFRLVVWWLMSMGCLSPFSSEPNRLGQPTLQLHVPYPNGVIRD